MNYSCPPLPLLTRRRLRKGLDADADHLFVRLKVWVASTLLCSEPDALTLGSHRLWGLHICENDVTITGMLIDILGWCIKASTATRYTLPDPPLTFLPDVNLVFLNLSVEGDHSKLRILGKSLQFCEESC